MDVFPYEYRPGQRELVSFISDATADGMCPVVEAGTGTGKTISALAGTIPTARARDLRILYLTRTKSQQAQVIRECGAIGDVVCIALQGRSASSCPMMRDDPDLRSGTPEEISKLCSEFKRRTETGCHCPYYANLEGADKEHWLSVLRDHPDPASFAEICEGATVCPYELMKQLLPHADVIAASYPFAFIPPILSRMEEWLGITRDRMILIADEAHNLSDYLRDTQTYEYSLRAMELVDREAKEQGDHEIHEGLTVTDISAVLKEVLAYAVKEYLIDDDGILPPHFVEEELMSRLGVTSVAIDRMARGLQDLGDIIEERRKQRRKLPRSYIGSMGRFLELWSSGSENCSVSLVLGGDNPCFQSYCMDPAPAATPLNECYSSVLMSGTLDPIDAFVKELGLERAVPRHFDGGFPPDNLLTLYSDRVSMRYEERFMEENYRSLMSLVCDSVNAVRVNTAVFFPSFDVMDRMIGDGLESRLGRDVYHERRDMPQSELMETFDRFKTSEGSVLFCVTGGRISEGLDFPDKALEMAVLIGIPYPRPTAKLRAMTRYYDMRFGDGRAYVATIPATRKMRQSIGRLIRSETDRGVAVLLDRRVSNLRLGAMLCYDIPAAVRAFFDAAERYGRPVIPEAGQDRSRSSRRSPSARPGSPTGPPRRGGTRPWRPRTSRRCPNSRTIRSVPTIRVWTLSRALCSM